MKYANFDDYINHAQPFAQPLLRYFRECVHEACPGVEETFKWGMPNFTYNGSILCHMASFKQHASFSFWLAKKMHDPAKIFVWSDDSGMGQFGKIERLEQLPEKGILLDYIKEAMALTDAGEKLTASTRRTTKVLEEPNFLLERLNQHPKAIATYSLFSQSHKNEYIEWITEAKTETTRNKRMDQMMEWLEEGKPRNWKYMKTDKWK